MWGKIKNAGDDWMYPKPLMDLRFILCYMSPYVEFFSLYYYYACEFEFLYCAFCLELFHILILQAMCLFLFTQWMEYKMHGFRHHAPFCGCR